MYSLPSLGEPNSPESHEYFMYQAFLAGMEHKSVSNPNPSVGCVIVKNNTIISKGCTEVWKGRHAEFLAFEKVKDQNLEGALVYLTLEPCTHYGNQPPCIELFRGRGIKAVYIARLDSNPIVSGKGIQLLSEFKIKKHIGILDKEVTMWNYPFFIQQKYKRPMVALKWAQSLDGCLADDSGKSIQHREPLSEQYTSWLRQKYDANLLSGTSLLRDVSSRIMREVCVNSERKPLCIIYDPKAQIFFCSKDKQKMLKRKCFTKNIKTLFLIEENMLIEVLSSSSKWCLELKTSADIKILPITGSKDFYSAKDVLNCVKHSELTEFFGRPLQSIFVEGDTAMIDFFIRDELFDVAHVITTPFHFGESCSQLSPRMKEILKNFSSAKISKANGLEILAFEKLGDEVLTEMIPEGRLFDVFY
jgi:diaminohydroxyphosphoribosylaminopyrimidine deaminase/5-amino-6-(5-phosphoribosylamino)uracil reductase